MKMLLAIVIGTVVVLVIGMAATLGGGGNAAPSQPSQPSPREIAYEQARQDFLDELTPERNEELKAVIREMQSSGLVQKIEDGAMFVDPFLWSALDLNLKQSAAHTAWLFSYQSDPRVTRILRIVDRRSGNRISKYTASQGLH